MTSHAHSSGIYSRVYSPDSRTKSEDTDTLTEDTSELFFQILSSIVFVCVFLGIKIVPSGFSMKFPDFA